MQRELMIDMLAVCESAPLFAHRRAANVLLAREAVATMDASDREYRSAIPPQPHPSYREIEGLGPSIDLGSMLESRDVGAAHGGSGPAAFYMWYGDAPGTAPGSSFDRPPASDAAAKRDRIRADVTASAAALRALVLTTMTAPDFAAARLKYVQNYQRQAFAARGDVARYAIGNEATAPGAAFQLASRGQVAGYSSLSLTDTPEITVPTPGTYRYSFRGSARSASVASSAAIKISLTVAGAEIASFSAVRASADPAAYVELGGGKSLYLPGEAATVEINGALTVRNGSDSELVAGGVLMLWRES